jgi:hypothetical protein
MSVDIDAPLRLEQAVQIAFPLGGMTVSGLRREAAKGRLVIEKIAGKDFVTLRAINEMREKCRDHQRAQDSGLNQKNATNKANLSGRQPGSSETDHIRSARAALEATAKALNKRSPTTSEKNTKSPGSAVVIPIKS